MTWGLIVTATIGAGASISASNKASKAQNNASSKNDVLAQQQFEEDKRRYDMDRQDKWDLFNAQMHGDEEAYQRVRGDNIGAMNRGEKAGNQLSYLMGLGDDGTGEKGFLSRRFAESDFAKDGGYDFRKKEGQDSVTNNFAQSGNLLSGAAMKALTRFNQDFASNEYGAAYSRFNNDQNSQYSRLSGIQTAGQNAVNSVAAKGSGSNAMAGLANSLGQTSAQFANSSNNYYNNLMSNNNARANSQSAYNSAFGNSLGSGLGNIAGAWNSYQKGNNNNSYPTQNFGGYDYLDF
jgi:hypothetical protein